jgi:nucleotide-binding universal stress UspA family protein
MSPHHERGPVVVGVDGSEQALHAVRWAAREAESLETSLQLTSALGYAADVRGSRRMGNSAVAGTLLGSVSQAVLHQASCPVAVVRPGTEHDAT